MKLDKSDTEKRQKNVINVAAACNQKCIFCSGYPETEIDISKVKSLVDAAEKEVFFQGGEPTLQPELVNLIRYAKQKGKKVTLVTNGLRLSYLKYTESLFNAGLDQVFFAFHAPNDKLNDFLSSHNSSFDNKVQALKNIIRLNQAHKVRLVYLINKHNQHDILNFVRFINQNFKGIGSIEFKLIQSLGNAEANISLFPSIEEFAKELNEAILLAKKYGLKIQTNGIPLCYLGDNFNSAIEYYMKTHEMKNLSGRIFIEKCANCSIKKYCMGYRSDYLKIISGKQ